MKVTLKIFAILATVSFLKVYIASAPTPASSDSGQLGKLTNKLVELAGGDSIYIVYRAMFNRLVNRGKIYTDFINTLLDPGSIPYADDIRQLIMDTKDSDYNKVVNKLNNDYNV